MMVAGARTSGMPPKQRSTSARVAALALLCLAGCGESQCLALLICRLTVNVKVPAQTAGVGEYDLVVRYNATSFRAHCLDAICTATGADASAEWKVSAEGDLLLTEDLRGVPAPDSISLWATRNGMVVANATVSTSKHTTMLCGATCTNPTAAVTLSN